MEKKNYIKKFFSLNFITIHVSKQNINFFVIDINSGDLALVITEGILAISQHRVIFDLKAFYSTIPGSSEKHLLRGNKFNSTNRVIVGFNSISFTSIIKIEDI